MKRGRDHTVESNDSETTIRRRKMSRKPSAIPDAVRMDALQRTSDQFRQVPPSKTLWQRFTAWLTSVFYTVEMVDEPATRVPNQNSFAGASAHLLEATKRESEERERDEERTGNFFRNFGTELTGGAVRVWNAASQKRRELQTSPEVQALKNSQAFADINAHHSVLKNDKRSHTYFFGAYTMKVDKAASLKRFIEAIDKATLMVDVDRAFQLYRRELRDTLGKGQNITTRALGLRTTSVKLIEALEEEKNNPTTPNHTM